MIKVCVLSESPTFRAGVTSLLRGSVSVEIEIIEQREIQDDAVDAVYIVFLAELGRYMPQIADKKIVLIQTPGENGSFSLLDHENGWGILPYDASDVDLAAVIAAVDRNLIVFPPHQMKYILEKKSSIAVFDTVDTGEGLTEREMEIVQLLGQGYPNKQIAFALGISENTVKFHISSIYSKFGVSNRTEALRAASKRGIISL